MERGRQDYQRRRQREGHPGRHHPHLRQNGLPHRRGPGAVPRGSGAAGRRQAQHPAYAFPRLQHPRLRGLLQPRRLHARLRRPDYRERRRLLRRQGTGVHLQRGREHVHRQHFRAHLAARLRVGPEPCQLPGSHRLLERRQYAFRPHRMVPAPGRDLFLHRFRARHFRGAGSLVRFAVLLPRAGRPADARRRPGAGHYPRRGRPGEPHLLLRQPVADNHE